MKKLFLLTLLFFGYSVSVKAIDVYPTSLSKASRSVIERKYADTSRKLLLYDPGLAEASCPHIQYYVKFMKKIMQEDLVREIYTLQKYPDFPKKPTQETANEWNTAFMECGPLCVVSLENNWIYPIKSPYWEEDVDRLMDTLDALAYQ